MRTLMSRVIGVAAAGAIALTTMSVQPAAAASRNDDAVAAAAAVAMFGTIAALIATSHHDHDGYVYSRGPVHYGHGPYVTGGRGHHRW